VQVLVNSHCATQSSSSLLVPWVTPSPPSTAASRRSGDARVDGAPDAPPPPPPVVPAALSGVEGGALIAAASAGSSTTAVCFARRATCSQACSGACCLA
jgi:hypothetical protein